LTNQIVRPEKSAERQTETFLFVLSRGLLHRTHIRSHPRLFGAAVVGILLYLLYWLLSDWAGLGSGFLIAFDGGALTFLTAVWVMMVRATPDSMRRRAETEDEGRYTVLTFGTAAASAVLLAIVLELQSGKNAASPSPHIVLAAATILLSWFFMNTIFALHYAHGYYGNADPSSEYQPIGGLVFPGQPKPDYWDFMYFSFVVGMTFQVSDVQIEDHSLRRVVLAHSVLAFFFNVVVLALTINIVAGLI
jgi:uncharacterized membrane protein